MKPTSGLRSFLSLGRRRPARLVGCVLLMTLIAGQLWMQVATRRSLADSQLSLYQSLTTQVARQVTAQVHFSLRNLNTLSSNHLLMGSTGEIERIEAVRQIAEAGTFWSDISLFNHDGSLFFSSSNDFTEPQERTEWFKRAAQGHTVVSTPHLTLARPGSLELAVYHPLNKTKNAGRPIVRGRVSLDDVTLMLRDVDLGGGHLVLLDSTGRTLYQNDSQQVGRRSGGVAGEAFASSESHGLSRDADGREMYWIAHRLAPDRTGVDEAWTLVAVIPRDQITAFVNRRSIVPLGAGLATLFVISGLGYGVSRRIPRPTLPVAEAEDRFVPSASVPAHPRHPPLHHQTRDARAVAEPETQASSGQ